ncbi:MAG: CHASE domain-containing protein [Chlamydiales bacterium]|nr:CHASE domain-containing protein [Chlamydiales bacterium]
MKARFYIVIALFFFGVTLVSWLMLDQLVQATKKTRQQIFNNQVEASLSSLTGRFSTIKTTMNGFEGFFAGSESVTYEEWREYSTHLQISKALPEIVWIGFVREVLASDKPGFSSSLQNSKIWPEADRARYFPIEFVTPEAYEYLMGYDLCTDEAVCEGLNERAFKAISAVPTLPHSSKKVNQVEKLLFLPIHKSSKFFGWVVAAVNFAEIIEQIDKDLLSSNLSLEVYSGEALGKRNLIFQKDIDRQAKPIFTSTKVLDLSGMKLVFVFEEKASTTYDLSAFAFYLFLFLILISILFGLFLYFRFLKKSGSLAETDQIEQNILSSISYTVIATDLNGTITFFNPAAEKLLGYSASEVIGKVSPVSFHDPDEIAQRAIELSSILKSDLKSDLDVFVALAENEIVEDRIWTYIKKDKGRVSVRLSVSLLRNSKGDVIGYVGFSVETSKLYL